MKCRDNEYGRSWDNHGFAHGYVDGVAVPDVASSKTRRVVVGPNLDGLITSATASVKKRTTQLIGE